MTRRARPLWHVQPTDLPSDHERRVAVGTRPGLVEAFMSASFGSRLQVETARIISGPPKVGESPSCGLRSFVETQGLYLGRAA